MNIEVHKYGGSSLSTLLQIRQIAARTIDYQIKHGVRVVLVLSAMGDTTDVLLSQAHVLDKAPNEQALDVLLSTGELHSCALMAMALSAGHVHARVCSGLAAGLGTDACFGQARIESVNPSHLKTLLLDSIVPVVTGYQGMSPEGAVTTLGRGGSDLTAVVLAQALQARCLIYTDVAGIYSANPKQIDDAHYFERIAVDDMLQFSMLGAQVLNTAAVRYMQAQSMSVSVHAAYEPDGPGTVVSNVQAEQMPVAWGVLVLPCVSEIRIREIKVPALLEQQLSFFKSHDVWVELCAAPSNCASSESCVLMVEHGHVAWCLRYLESAGFVCDVKAGRAMVSIVGQGIRSQSVAAQLIVDQSGIVPLRWTRTSSRLSVVVFESHAQRILQLWHVWGAQVLDTEPVR